MAGDLREADPQTVGEYRILGRLGEGGSSTVFLGQAADGSRVAIKVLHPTLAESPAVRDRLRREALTLQRVLSTRTAGVLSVDAEGPIPHLVMQFVEGENLATITERSPLTGPLLTALAEGLTEALEAIHACDVVHRDLKPQNIIYGPAGVVVVDFGTSVLAEVAGATRTGELTGTPGWLAPEQALGHPVTPAADVFNFGMVLAYAGTGQHPFGQGRPDAMLFRVVHQDPDLSRVPERLKLIVGRCLDKEPANRPTLDEIRESLSLVGGSAWSADGQLDRRTRLGSTTRIGSQAVRDAALATRRRGPWESLTKRQKQLVGGLASVAAALAAAFLVVGGAIASGPVEYTVVDNSTPANQVLSEPVVRIRSASQVAEFSLKFKPATTRRITGLEWSTAHPLIVEYVPGFANDEPASLQVDMAALGNNLITRGWRTEVNVQIFDEYVQIAVRAPETRQTFFRRRTTLHDVRLARQNEAEYLRLAAQQLFEAQVVARNAHADCASELIRETNVRMAPILDLLRVYNESLTANRLNQGGTFSEATFRSRISGLLSDMDSHIRLTRGRQLSDGWVDFESTKRVAEALAGTMIAHQELEVAWSRYRLALFELRPCSRAYCSYKDLYPGEDRAVENARVRLFASVDEARGAIGREAFASCEALHPIPEG